MRRDTNGSAGAFDRQLLDLLIFWPLVKLAETAVMRGHKIKRSEGYEGNVARYKWEVFWPPVKLAHSCGDSDLLTLYASVT
jgi:hypothetical protein